MVGIPLYCVGWRMARQRYVSCKNIGSAKNNHVGWKWPESLEFTWCADKYRKLCSKKPPKEPRPPAPPAPTPAPPPPAPPPPTFPRDWVTILIGALPYCDYEVQETIAKISKAVTPDLIQFRFKELPFNQHNFPWLWKKGIGKQAKKVKVTSACTFIASTAAVTFYERPQHCMSHWQADALWHECMQQGKAMHEFYTRAVTFKFDPSVLAVMGAEALHCTPNEYVAHFDLLLEKHVEFVGLRALFAERSLRSLTDVCPACNTRGHDVGMTGDCSCNTCDNVVTKTVVPTQKCFDLMTQHAHAHASQPHAFVAIIGARTFFVGVKAPDFIAMDSHLRTFRGHPRDNSSICIKGCFGPNHNLAASLGEVWRRGVLGYKDTEKGSVWTWGDVGTGTPVPPLIVYDDAPSESAHSVPASAPSVVPPTASHLVPPPASADASPASAPAAMPPTASHLAPPPASADAAPASAPIVVSHAAVVMPPDGGDPPFATAAAAPTPTPSAEPFEAEVATHAGEACSFAPSCAAHASAVSVAASDGMAPASASVMSSEAVRAPVADDAAEAALQHVPSVAVVASAPLLANNAEERRVTDQRQRGYHL